MQQIKRFRINVKFIIIISSFFILDSCREKTDEPDLSIAMSRPFNCPTDGAKIIFFSKGEFVSSARTLTDIGEFGWAYPQNAVTYGSSNELPDSVAVDYGGLNTKLEMCTYKGGKKLPIVKMQELLKKGYKENNKKTFYRNIIVGLAPGGRICVWMDHIELLRFKVPEIDVYFKTPIMHFGDSIDIMEYLKKHPVDYSVWENADKRYDLDFGFTSEEKNIEFSAIYYISREGIRNTFFNQEIDHTQWNVPYGKKPDQWGVSYQQQNETIKDHKLCLPVDVQVKWYIEKKVFDTKIVMPKDVPQKFSNPYINPKTNKQDYYNRIVFGVEKDGKHCTVWLDGPNKQEKIIRFRGEISSKEIDGKPDDGIYATDIKYY